MKKKIIKKEVSPLAGDSFWVINKSLARHLKSNDAVVLLAELAYKQGYWDSKGKLDKEDGFFAKGAELEKDVNINKRQRLKLTKILVKAGLIVVKRRGRTARNWYRVQFSVISDTLTRLHRAKATALDEYQILSWSETAPINNKVVRNGIVNENLVASLQPKEGKLKKVKKDTNLQVSSLVQDTFLKVEMLHEVCQRYLDQHPEHTSIVEAMVFIIKHDTSISADPSFPDNKDLCLNQLDNLIRGRGLSQKEVRNIERIYEKNIEHQERLANGGYRRR